MSWHGLNSFLSLLLGLGNSKMTQVINVIIYIALGCFLNACECHTIPYQVTIRLHNMPLALLLWLYCIKLPSGGKQRGFAPKRAKTNLHPISCNPSCMASWRSQSASCARFQYQVFGSLFTSFHCLHRAQVLTITTLRFHMPHVCASPTGAMEYEEMHPDYK